MKKIMLTVRTMTNTEFFEFVHRPENEGANFELLHGELYQMPSPTPLHGLIAARILFFLMQFVLSRNLGYVLGDSNDFALAPGIVVKPDAAFIAGDRLPRVPDRFELAPDLAVEVLSPSNLPYEFLDKVEAYLRYGTRIVWVVYPQEQRVRVYRIAPDGEGIVYRTFNADETLSGDDMLQGFSVKVGDLFPSVENNEP